MIWIALAALALSIGNWFALWYVLKAVRLIADEVGM